jgi:hypothetical protein
MRLAPPPLCDVDEAGDVAADNDRRKRKARLPRQDDH